MAGIQIDETLMLSGTEGFIKALANAAKQTQKDFGIFASVTLGQAIIESGWGKSNVAKENKNLFGIKYSSGYKPAPGINVKAAGRQCPSSEQGGAMYYVFYESYGDSVYDHGNFLKVNPRYTKAGVFTAKDAKEQMKAICSAGYAEVGGQYSTSVIAAMDKYNLYQYDDLNGFSGMDISYSSSGSSDGSGYGTGMDILPNVDHRYNIANMDEVKGACLIFLPPYNVCTIDQMEAHFQTWNNWDRQYHYLIDPTYDIDANPDDDIPDLSNAKSVDEMNNSSDDSNNDTEDPNEGTEDDNNNDYADPDELPEDNRPRTIQPRAPLGPDDMDSGTNTPQQPGDGGDTSNPDDTTTDTTTPTGPAPEEDNSIVIKGGFQIDRPRLLQCYGLEDNDKTTYINRSLYNSKPTAHCLMIACFIPTYDQLQELNTNYTKVERNIVNAVSKILWANGLTTDDLWREFDMNRAPSPAVYLNRNDWTDLLLEINKQLVWRNKKFGKVVTKYEKYVAVIPDQTIAGDNLGAGTPGGGSSGTPGTMDSGNEVANTAYSTFTGLGLSPEAACGVLGNIYQESGMNPKAVNKSSGATGLCQWLGGRLTGLKNYASSKGTDWTDVKTQCEWAWMECEGKDSTTKSLLDKNCGGPEGFKKLTLEKAVDMWRRCFERCGENEANDAKRLSMAKEYYSKIVSNGSSSASYTIQPRDKEDDNNGDSGSSGGTGTSRLLWPVPGHDVGSGAGSKFGMRLHPIKKVMKMHNGIDIPAPGGTSIKAAADGEVTVNAYQAGGAGNYIKIKHAQGLETVYMHMQSKSPLSVGTKVTSGQEVGKVGTTGGSTGNHLHFEVHENGEKKDPLLFTNKDNSASTVTGDIGGSSNGYASTGDWIYNGPIITSLWGDIKNPGPAGNLPYNGNSMGGLEHDDWGGKMSYYVEDPSDEEAEKPIIDVVFTDAEYKVFCEEYFIDDIFKEDGEIESVVNFNKFWQLIDLVAGEHEPYDKGLISASDAAITPNDRLGALTTTFTTDNENVFHFNVIESGPGSNHHCVKAADELNYIITPTDLRVEPIYPDLIIPPQFTTSGYDSNSENSIPLSQLTEVEGKEFLTKQLSFDYDILKDMKKETNKCFGPINFMDPYPTDDKIEELEQHYPKVFIDEIEAQLYSCNHPGCPIGQPMAKNFAMLSDAVMNQSKRVEKRLVRLENILSTIMRNQARLSSRININCVYYGGQSTYAGKYKCIRCMHDDRINDGAIVTLDQCLNCTRYEPILGQVYQILDETGYNGSIILDDMQMSYSDLETFKRLNIQSEQSPKYTYVNVNDDTLTKKPEKDLIELWKEANKEAYIKTLPDYVDVEAGLQQKDEMTNQDVATTDEPVEGRAIAGPPDGGGTVEDETTDPGLVEDPKIEEALESKYIFRMNWNETFLNSQQPDTKQYPTEGIIMRFKKQEGDYSYNEELNELDPEKDLDVIEDIQKQLKLINGIWTDTREKADTMQVNKYSSEKFYFDGFAEMKATSGPGSGSSSNGLGSAECRKKICEMAETIVKECDDGKAWYSQTNRTYDYNKPGYHNGKKAYDCSGFVSCCYMHAGLKSMYAKSCSGGTLMDEIVNNHGEMWLLNDAGLSKAKPGDVLVTSSKTVSESDMGQKVDIDHAMIYMGDNTIAHAANSKKGIVKEKIEDWRKAKSFFVRPKDLIDADAAASSGGGTGQVNETEGEVDGQKYVARILGAVCTSYTGGGSGSSGMGCEYNKTCASHNLPYGTKVYIPQLADKTGGNGVYTVTDTGGPYFDFDIYTTTNISKGAYDAYVLEWGSGSVSQSFTKSIDEQVKLGQWNKYKSAWDNYKTLGGKLVTFTKYNQEDANIKNHPNYNDK